MELREYLRVLRRRAWIPVLLVLVTTATAAVLSFVTKPQYTATATVLAQGPVGALTFPEVVNSNTLALRTVKDAHLSVGASELAGRIRVVAGRTNLYQITLTDANANQAVTLANAVAKKAAQLYTELNAANSSSASSSSVATDVTAELTTLLTQYQTAAKARLDYERQHPELTSAKPVPVDPGVGAQDLMLKLQEDAANANYLGFAQGTTATVTAQVTSAVKFDANVIDEAAAKPDTSGRPLRIAYAAVLGLILGIGLIFLLEYLDNSVREPEAAEAIVGQPVLGIIPRATGRTLRAAKGAA
jgi:capsular polysaccharide biosynthesis protein